MVKISQTALLSLWLVLSLTAVALADTFIHTERSLYRNIYVSEDDDVRCIRFNSQRHTVLSCLSLESPETILFDCNKMMLGALYLNPAPRKVLMVGLGGGTLVSALAKILPTANIDVVELDPAVVRVAREYFGFRPSARVHVITEDGRVYVKRAIARGTKYDVVILDAFDEKYIPAHMMTADFFAEVRKILAADGVLAANTYLTPRYDSESATYQSVFGDFFNLKPAGKRSRVIIAKLNGLPSEEVLARNSRALEARFRRFGVDSPWLLSLFSTEADWDSKSRLFTDWFMPF
jgi:spermidine synthase